MKLFLGKKRKVVFGRNEYRPPKDSVTEENLRNGNLVGTNILQCLKPELELKLFNKQYIF